MRARLVAGLERGRLAGHDQLLRGSAWLTASVAAHAVSGFAFSVVAARAFSEDAFGEAAALFTSIQFVNYATSMGLPIAVGRYARERTPTSAVLFRWAVILTTATSVVGTVLFLALAPSDVLDAVDDLGAVGRALAFFVAVAGMSITLLVEIRLMALRRWGWVLGRIVVIGLLRLPLLAMNPTGDAALWIWILLAGLPAISGVVLAFGLTTRTRFRLTPLPVEARPALRFATVNYASLIALQAPQFVLPLIVAVSVSSTSYSAFYVAFQIATIVFLIPHTLGQVLLVEGDSEPGRLTGQVKVALVVTTGLMAVFAAIATLGAGIVPTVYGAGYELAADLLPMLVGAGIGWGITSILLTRARVAEDTPSILGIAVVLACAILVPAVVLTDRNGAEGAAMAWFFGNGVAALAAIAITVRPWRRRSAAEDWTSVSAGSP